MCFVALAKITYITLRIVMLIEYKPSAYESTVPFLAHCSGTDTSRSFPAAGAAADSVRGDHDHAKSKCRNV